jgi:DNA-binding SARP family transcriptional activator
MRFGVLGSLLVEDDAGGARAVVGARRRVLLAALLVRANRVVPAGELAEIVWDGAPPAAAAALPTQVMRLRRDLGGEAAARIVTREPGYLIMLDDAELDAAQFEALYRDAGAAVRAGQWQETVDAAGRAEGMWRGAALADVDSRTLREECAGRLEQLRVQAVEWRVQAELHLGRHEQLVAELRDLAQRHPLREHVRGQLMLALYRCGRQAEALDAYRQARRALVEELGIEPGPELRRLHERILAGDADLLAPSPSETAPRPDRPSTAPRQLPATVRHFTGRQAELDELIRLVGEADAPGGTVLISAIDGMAGVGKTALAVHVACRLAEKFPDGQLFLDLHGYTRGRRPRTADEALDWLLRALRVPPDQIPKDGEQAAALYRQRLADTKTLIVLDNAMAEAQVRPLLPGAEGCLVIVTSRRRLKGLDDAHSVSLDVLAAPDAIALLRAVAGPDRVPDGDPLAGEIAGLCGHLPLALRIAAALLRHRPAWSLEHLAGLLREQHRRLPALSDGDRDLGSVFDLSYRSLPADLQRVFRCLGLVPGPDLDAYAAAALTGTDPAAGLLEDLVDHNLLIAYAPGRYRLHDLVRAHARALASTDPEPDRDSALDRLLHYYAHTAQSASILIARYPRPAPDGPAPAHVPALSGADGARAWLRAERDNLEAASAHARAHALDGPAIALAAGLAVILRTDGPRTRALDLHQAAVEAAERHGRPAAHADALIDLATVRRLTGDLAGAANALSQALEIHRATGERDGEAAALTDLGGVRQMTGDLAGALDALSRALEIYRATGRRPGEAATLTDLGVVRYLAGDLAGAGDALSRALEIYRETGNRLGEATALTYLGRMRQVAGDLAGATDALSRTLEIFREVGNRDGEATVLTDLGVVQHLTGDLAGALDALSRALEIHRETGNGPGEATTLVELGTVRQMTGDLAGSLEALSRALEIFRMTGNRSNEAWALNHYAATIGATGDLPGALELYRQALTMNRELNKPDDEAIALEGIGECRLSTGETEPGTAHLHQALEIFQRLGMAADASRVQDRLDGLDGADGLGGADSLGGADGLDGLDGVAASVR